MTKQFPPGAQDPAAPHPGTIAFLYDWNGAATMEKASDFPESFIFRCFDHKGERVDRAHAWYCIPVVEIQTTSVDENGKGVAPQDADFIENSAYGPGHVFLQHTSSAPHLKALRKREQQNVPKAPASSPSGDIGRPGAAYKFSDATASASAVSTGRTAMEDAGKPSRLSFWQRIKRIFSS